MGSLLLTLAFRDRDMRPHPNFGGLGWFSPDVALTNLTAICEPDWDRMLKDGRWRKAPPKGGWLKWVADEYARRGVVEATAGTERQWRLELGGEKLELWVPLSELPTRPSVFVERVQDYVGRLADDMDFDLGFLRQVGLRPTHPDKHGRRLKRFPPDALIDFASLSSFDSRSDAPTTKTVFFESALPKPARRIHHADRAALTWVENFEPDTFQDTIDLRADWLRNEIDLDWESPQHLASVRVFLAKPSIANATSLVQAMMAGEPGRPWPATTDFGRRQNLRVGGSPGLYGRDLLAPGQPRNGQNRISWVWTKHWIDINMCPGTQEECIARLAALKPVIAKVRDDDGIARVVASAGHPRPTTVEADLSECHKEW